eukprot:CAMPEP_0175172414 /NCGR_PEP_ID=MMETSP0087-20121206/31418_1 /TAXON_ID=136419 /ORGANISM="Unknown Unknown, Strain D1" /LENGTH=198 /DNA_ID=CAMNT_0016463479 /DNA_START=147 /DNA_END=743 /DNA_ORIENTATION=-
MSEQVLELARKNVQGLDNVSLICANVYELPFEDGSFDIVYAHQVLQHLADPVGALREMKRVLKPSGYAAVRDADYSSMLAYPPLSGIDEWRRIYRAVALRNGAQPDAGRYLRSWLAAAGFSETHPSLSVVPHFTGAEVANFGQAWAVRIVESDMAKQAVNYGIASRAQLEDISRTWQAFSATEDASLYYVNGEALARA